MKLPRWCASLVLLSSAVFNAAPVAAQAFPHKPVRVIIPYGPGGGSDIILRSIVPKLSEQFGHDGAQDDVGTAAWPIRDDHAHRLVRERLRRDWRRVEHG